MASEGQAVRFRDCTCPGTPHNGRDGADDGDIVYLRDHLGFAAGAEAYRMMVESITRAGGDTQLAAQLMTEIVGPVYLREGPMGWNLLEQVPGIEGYDPVPLSKDALSDLPFSEGKPIVDKADELYSLEISRPLVMRTNGQSDSGQTGKRTPRRTPSSSSRRSQSKSSSRNGTDGTLSVVSP